MKASKANLRTRSGCNSCRQRRKKCDEVKPVCTRCRKGSVECIWRTSEQLSHDGRRRTSPISSASRTSSPPTQLEWAGAHDIVANDPWLLPLVLPDCKTVCRPVRSRIYEGRTWDPAGTAVIPSIPFDSVNDSALFSYYLNQLLPSTIHESYQSQHSDFSYWSSMAAVHQPLMDTALACAAMSISHRTLPGTDLSAKLRQKAVICQTSAVTSIRDFINSGSATGGEDWLLAAVESLVLFTTRDPEGVPAHASPHIMALAEIFKRREAVKQAEDIQTPVRQRSSAPHVRFFERICYESMLYHSAIFMWFDRSLDALTEDTVWEMVDKYFRRCPPSGASADGAWPILGVPYTLFKLITAVSRLSRQNTLSEADLDLAKIISGDLMSWRELVDAKREYSIARLYVYVAMVLLQHVLSKQQEGASQLDTLPVDVGQCMSILASTQTATYFSGYQMWPISVLGTLATEEDHKLLTAERMATVMRNMDCANTGN